MAYENRPKDFFAKQIRSSHLIASGGIIDPGSSDWDEQLPHLRLMIYPRDALETVAGAGTEYIEGAFEGIVPTHLLDDPFDSASGEGSGLKVGDDVWLFISGTQNSMHETMAGRRDSSGVVLFGGDVVVSGTLYAERQVIEVDLSQEGQLFISGNLVAQDYNKDINFIQFMGPQDDYPRNWNAGEQAILSFTDRLSDGVSLWNEGKIKDGGGEVTHDVTTVGWTEEQVFTLEELNTALLAVNDGAQLWVNRNDLIVEGIVYSAYDPSPTGEGHTIFNIDSINDYIGVNTAIPSASLDVRRSSNSETINTQNIVLLGHDSDNVGGTSNPLKSGKEPYGLGHHDDTALYVWGIPNGKEDHDPAQQNYTVSTFGGDVVVSGTIYTENGVIDIGSIHDTISGNATDDLSIDNNGDLSGPIGALRFSARETGSDQASGIAAQIQVEAAGPWEGADVPARMNLYTNSTTPAMTITDDGSVGINVESPSSIFNIKQATSGPGAGLRLTYNDSDTNYSELRTTVWPSGLEGLLLDTRGFVQVKGLDGAMAIQVSTAPGSTHDSATVRFDYTGDGTSDWVIGAYGQNNDEKFMLSKGYLSGDNPIEVEKNSTGAGNASRIVLTGVEADASIFWPYDADNGTYPGQDVDGTPQSGDDVKHPLKIVGLKEDNTDYHPSGDPDVGCLKPKVLIATPEGNIVYAESVIGKLGQDQDGRYFNDDEANGEGEDVDGTVGIPYDNGQVNGWDGDTLVGHAVDEINHELKTVADAIADFAGTQAWDWSDIDGDEVGDYAILKDPNNSVGIGTSTPQTKLHVYGPDGVSATIRIESTSIDADGAIVNEDAHAVIQFASDGDIQATVGMHINPMTNDPDALLVQSHNEGGDLYFVSQHENPGWGGGIEDGTLPQITLAGALQREHAQVLILSGANSNGTGHDTDPRTFVDSNFYVSGSAGSANQAALGQVGNGERGTSVFAGDVFVSGTIFCENAVGFGAGIPNTVLVVDYEASSTTLTMTEAMASDTDIMFNEVIHQGVITDDDDVSFKRRMRVYINGVRIQGTDFTLSATGQKYIKLKNMELDVDDVITVDVIGNPNIPGDTLPAELDHITPYFEADLTIDYYINIPDGRQIVGVDMPTGSSRTIKLPYPGDQAPGTEIAIKDEVGSWGETDTALYVVAAGATPDTWSDIDQHQGTYTIGDNGVAGGTPLTFRQSWACVELYTNGTKWFIK